MQKSNKLIFNFLKELKRLEGLCSAVVCDILSLQSISAWGCGGQCQPPTPAGSDNGINNIFFCVVPSTWPP